MDYSRKLAFFQRLRMIKNNSLMSGNSVTLRNRNFPGLISYFLRNIFFPSSKEKKVQIWVFNPSPVRIDFIRNRRIVEICVCTRIKGIAEAAHNSFRIFLNTLFAKLHCVEKFIVQITCKASRTLLFKNIIGSFER